MPGTRPRHLRLQARLALACAGLALLTSAALTVALLAIFRTQMRRSMESNLRRLAAMAATHIDGDAHSELRSREDETSPAYAAQKRRLQEVRLALGGKAAYVYTMRADAQGQVVFVVDSETDPESLSHLGDAYPEASAWLRQHVSRPGAPAVEPGLNTDRWGTWMSGFAPIYTSRHVFDGVVGVDVPATQVTQAGRCFLYTSLLVFLATAPLAAWLGFWLGRRLAGPVVRLRDATARVTEGDLSGRVQVERSDEIGDLAQAFNVMAERLQESYADLETRVVARTAELAAANHHLHVEIGQRARLEHQLREMSQRDGLTGLANRLAFDERLDEEWRRAARAGRPLSLIMCDVDHFKAYNDHHGHLAGDACLQAVASVVRRTLSRPGDFAARWGGEEFAVILADTPEEGATSAAERLREAVEEEALPRAEGEGQVVTVSVGSATAYPAWQSAPDDLQGAADSALYAAKAAGRNCSRQASVTPPSPTEPFRRSRIPA